MHTDCGNKSNNKAVDIRIRRLPIPDISSCNMRVGKEGQLKHSWSVAPNNFFRIYRDEPLHLELEFIDEIPSAKVMLYTNLLSANGEWGEIEFIPASSRKFVLAVNPVRCGIFRFKVKYSLNNGETWLWDRTPSTKIIIDPSGAKNIRLYTMIPIASGHLGMWKEDLSRIRDMGFTMVHLLPVSAMDKSRSPYAAADLFQIDPSFLNPDDHRDGLDQFEDFVLEAKKCGLGLCLDVVLNHIGLTSKMVSCAPEWIVPDRNEKDGLLRAGCWHMNSWIKWGDLVRINYDLSETKMRQNLWDYMGDYALFWANYAAYTGGMIRLDNLHSSHHEFIASLLATVRKKYPSLIIQAEYFSDSNTLLKAASEFELTLLLANPWEYPFAEQLRDYIKYLHNISSQLRFLAPVTTHDTGVAAQLYGEAEAIIPRYFVMALMGTGQTGIVQGAEHGVAKKIEFIGKNYIPAWVHPDKFTPMIKKINEIHASSDIFHRGKNIIFIDNSHGALLIAVREDRENNDPGFLLCANLDIKNSYTMKIDCGSWNTVGKKLILHDLIHEQYITLDAQYLSLELEPCGIRAYRMESDAKY